MHDEFTPDKADAVAEQLARSCRAQFETESGSVVTGVVVLVAYGKTEAAYGEDSEHHALSRVLVSDFNEWLNRQDEGAPDADE